MKHSNFNKCASGFDNPLSNPDDDQLDRMKLINQIYPYLVDIEPKWSVRVGILARWGEGKTTICQWISQKAEKDGHIPVWFSPWGARTDAQLWIDFYIALRNAIKCSKEIKDRNFFGKIKRWAASLSNKNIIKEISQLHELADSGLNFIQYLTKMSPVDIKKLQEELGDKRFIIIIDDLDRVNPDLIPNLFMTLRDILDLEGFSFLLPFDNKIVSDSLLKYNDAEGFGDNFLEKILDFRIYLNAPAKKQLASFFKNEMQLYCSFIPESMLEGLEDHLPTNPRKLKILVRSIRIFCSEAERHRDEEIDWKALIFIQMIKIESEIFFNMYIKETFPKAVDNNQSIAPWILTDNDEKDRVQKILKEANVDPNEKEKRLLELCINLHDSYRSYGIHKIEYTLKLLTSPEIITWAEFDEFWEIWSERNDVSALLSWFKDHAEKQKKQQDDVIREILITLTYQYDTHLEKASSVRLRIDQEGCIEKAKEILTLYNQFIEHDMPSVLHRKILDIGIFEKVIDVIRKWFNFRGNASDISLRKEEEALLKKWAWKAHKLDLAHDYYDFLDNDYLDNRDNFPHLIQELSESVKVKIEETALEALKKREGISAIFLKGAGKNIKRILLDVNSNIWKPQGNSSAEQILSTATTNPAVQLNALDFLHLLLKASNQGISRLDPNKVCEFYNHPPLIVAIWNAAIATELQYRGLQETREIRDSLIKKGISAEILNVPEWLMSDSEKS